MSTDPLDLHATQIRHDLMQVKGVNLVLLDEIEDADSSYGLPSDLTKIRLVYKVICDVDRAD